jgi:dienelactone hydrolase
VWHGSWSARVLRAGGDDARRTRPRDQRRRLVTNRLDLSRVGYLGAPFGGSVVVQALLEEPRIKAGVAEDGKPFAVSDAQLAGWGLTLLEAPSRITSPGRCRCSDASAFRSTTCTSAHEPRVVFGFVSDRAPTRIINDYTLAFFERYLNGIDAPLVDGATPSPHRAASQDGYF